MAFEREFVADCTFFIFVCTLKSSKKHFSIFALSLSSDLANFQDIKMTLTVFEKELFVSVCVSFHFVYTSKDSEVQYFSKFRKYVKKGSCYFKRYRDYVIRKGIVCTCLYLSYFCLYFKGSEIQRFSIFAKSGSERPIGRLNLLAHFQNFEKRCISEPFEVQTKIKEIQTILFRINEIKKILKLPAGHFLFFTFCLTV